jgi:hypothetical protein
MQIGDELFGRVAKSRRVIIFIDGTGISVDHLQSLGSPPNLNMHKQQ